MLRLALTGTVASGKSTVARIWSDAGVPVIRADDLAREVVAPGSFGLEQVVREFGEDVLMEDGSLDRPRLREEVFGDEKARSRLEAILHPLIEARRNEWLERLVETGTPVAAAEIPLLFEVGLEKEFDVVVAVVAPDGECMRRLMEDRGLAEEEASRMLAAQLPSEVKVSRADYVLENGGTLEDLEIRALALLDLLRARARMVQRI